MTCKGCGNSYNLFKGKCEYCGTYVDGMEKTVQWQEKLNNAITVGRHQQLIGRLLNDDRVIIYER